MTDDDTVETPNEGEATVDDTVDVSQTDEEAMPPNYMDMVVTHMLHRIWELQVAGLLMQAETDKDREFINEIVQDQQRGEYTQPLLW